MRNNNAPNHPSTNISREENGRTRLAKLVFLTWKEFFEDWILFHVPQPVAYNSSLAVDGSLEVGHAGRPPEPELIQSSPQIIHFDDFHRLQTIACVGRTIAKAAIVNQKLTEIFVGFPLPFDLVRFCNCQVNILVITEGGKNSGKELTILDLLHLLAVFVVEVARHDK